MPYKKPKIEKVIFTIGEVAEMIGVPVGTVKSRISRARIKLAEIIRKKGTF